MIRLADVKEQIKKDPEHGIVFLMDFVDDFRAHKNLDAFSPALNGEFDKWDALLASTSTRLCHELGLTPPAWLNEIPACKIPWFVSGSENLKAISLAESPLEFRLRKIFVLSKFLERI